MYGNKTNKNSDKVSFDDIDFVNNIKNSLDLLAGDITLSEIAENADIPFSTLRNIMYGKSTDCKLSTAVKLAKSLSITVDELVGAETMSGNAQESISIYRDLPARSQYLVRWFVKHQDAICKKSDNKKIITVMIPKDTNGYFLPSNVFVPMDIENFSDMIKAKVFFGMRITTDYYMPHYSPFDTLLIANDRPPLKKEHCVILYYGKFKIVTRTVKTENGKKVIKYHPIRNQNATIEESEIDEYIGYVAEVYKDTKS